MKVLIVGSGGREHAIAWSVSKSPKVDKIYCAPGNAGIAELAECVDIGAMEFEKLADFAQEKAIDLTIIGMDDPLVGGVVDVFEARGLKVFGPRKNAAILEGSKAFSKDLMKKYNIPTAAYENFDDPEKALEYLRTEARFPIVLKADGLALGKGVLICQDLKEAEDGVKEIMEDKKFGNAGNTMVIEEFMTGREVSVLSFVDGKTIRTMTSAQDHKRAQDGDQGLNTGGMGTFSPSPFYTEEVDEFCRKYVYQPTVDAMAAEGRPFKGIIFFGLMLTADGPKVLEYNARFGDPEAQVVLPRMKNDIIEVMEACVNGTLDQVDLQFEDNAAVCVVLASDGYPVKYEKGIPMYGFENFKGKDGYYCFHAGTKLKDGQIVTNGGRVLGITATGKDLKEGTDYEIKYVDNVYGQKGKDKKQYAAVLAVAKGKFGGNLTTSDVASGISVKDGVYTDAAGNKITNVFKIDLIEITQEEITASCVSVSNGTYAAGLPVKPSVKIVVKGRTLVEGTDYDLNVSANKDVINATEKQTLLVTVEPKNGYKLPNSVTLTYAWGIDKFDLANAEVAVDGDKVTVKCGKVEVPADEYTVTKDAAANKVTVTATKGNKNYKGSKTVSAVVTDPTEKPATPMISSVKVVGNKATVILSGEAEDAAGYDYVISTSKDPSDTAARVDVIKNQVQTTSTFKYVQQGTYYAYCHAWKRDENGKKVDLSWDKAYTGSKGTKFTPNVWFMIQSGEKLSKFKGVSSKVIPIIVLVVVVLLIYLWFRSWCKREDARMEAMYGKKEDRHKTGNKKKKTK